MQRWSRVVLDDNGRRVSGATVTVYNTGTTTLANIYSATSTSDTPTVAITNPITTGSDGLAAFAAADGDYDIIISGSNVTTENLYRVNFFDGTTATTGSQSSFALTMPSEFTVTGSPGVTIGVTKANETANTVWAGPTTGGAAAPTFRALVAADVNPVAVDLTTNQTAAGNKTFSGNVSVGGTFGATGTATFSGAATVGTTLGVTGAATFSSTGSFAEPLSLSKELTFTAYNNSSPTTGDFWLDSTSKSPKWYNTSTTHTLGGCLINQTSAVNVNNTVTETTLLASAYNLQANYLTVGKTLKFRASGVIGNTATPNIRFRFKIGSGTVCDTGAVAMSTITGSMAFDLSGYVTVRTIGGAGTAIGFLRADYQTANGTSPISVTAGTVSTTTIDTTAVNALNLTVEWGTASGSNTITITNLIVEVTGG
jgi:hypothetical protein